MTFLFVLTLFTYFLVTTTGIPEDRDVNIYRPDNGVVFRRVGPVMISAHYWYHRFIIPFPQFQRTFGKTLSDQSKAMYFFNQTVTLLQEQLAQVDEFAIESIQNITHCQARQHRIKMDILYALKSSLSISINGTTNYSDFSGKQFRDSFVADQENLESFMTLPNKMSSNLNHHLANIDEAFVKLESDITKYRDHLQSLEALFELREKVQRAAIEVSYIEAAINQLSIGLLPSSLVPPVSLRSAIAEINAAHVRSGSAYRLLHENPNHYYERLSYVSSMVGRDIWITLKMQLGLKSQYKLYDVVVFDLPAGNHSTRIIDLPDYVMIDGDRFQELTNAEVQMCRWRDPKACRIAENTLPLNTTDSCVAALVTGRASMIHGSCSFQASKTEVRSHISYLVSSKILVVAFDSLTLTCEGRSDSIISGCKLCLLTVTCNCKVAAPNGRVVSVPSARACKWGERPSTVHFRNFHILYAYLDSTSVPKDEAFSEDSLLWLYYDGVKDQFSKDVNGMIHDDRTTTVELQNLAERARHSRETRSRIKARDILLIDAQAVYGGFCAVALGLFIAVFAIAYYYEKLRRIPTNYVHTTDIC